MGVTHPRSTSSLWCSTQALQPLFMLLLVSWCPTLTHANPYSCQPLPKLFLVPGVYGEWQTEGVLFCVIHKHCWGRISLCLNNGRYPSFRLPTGSPRHTHTHTHTHTHKYNKQACLHTHKPVKTHIWRAKQYQLVKYNRTTTKKDKAEKHRVAWQKQMWRVPV